MAIKRSTSDIIVVVPSCETAKEFLDATWQKFKELDKAKIDNLMNKFINT